MPDFRSKFEYFLLGRPVAENGDEEAFCPKHEDPQRSRKPSALLNFKQEIWFCFVCRPEGRDAGIRALSELLAERITAGDIVMDDEILRAGERRLQLFGDKPRLTKKKREQRPIPSDELLDDWTEALLENEEQMTWLLQKRLVTEQTVKARRLGYNGPWHRFMIPCYGPDRKVYDCRAYHPDPAADQDKLVWYRGGNNPELFGAELPVHDGAHDVFLLEGEWDQILAVQDGLPALTHSGGATKFDVRWAEWFAGKNVYFVYDNDKAGKEGREKAARVLIQENTPEAIYFIDIPPVAGAKDYTDWRLQGNTVADFQELVQNAQMAPRWRASAGDGKLPVAGDRVTLVESQDASRNGKPLELEVSVSGKVEPAYTLPRHVVWTCDEAKAAATCNKCPMSELYGGEHKKDFSPTDTLVRNAIDATTEQLHKMLRREVGALCSDHLDIETESYWPAEELIVADSIERQREGSDPSNLTRAVYVIGSYATPANTLVRVMAEQLPGKDNQRGTLFGWAIEPVETAIDSFRMTAELRRRLHRVFAPRGAETPLQAAYRIARDETYNVTKIWGREDLHVAYALVYHSVLHIPLLGKNVKGWLDVAFPGDGRTGKSDTATYLRDHYQAGTLIGCDQTSLSGLIGGLQQLDGGRWTTTWGVLPQNDRRLAILDESHSMVDKGIIEQTSSIRSSGRAEIRKIQSAQTTARVRLIWILNPPSGVQLSALPDGGMEALRQLMPAHEDIARFDFAMAIGKGEVDPELINSQDHGQPPPHEATSEMASALVMWAWSRKAEQVVWGKGVEAYLLRQAVEMGRRYSSDFPLVQAENVREKIARMAVALAARTFSTDEAGETVIVRKQHVHDVLEFMHQAYASELMGYARLSQRAATAGVHAEDNAEKAREYLSGNARLPDGNGPRVAAGLRSVGGRFTTRSFADSCAMSLDEAAHVLRWLEDHSLVRRRPGGAQVEPQPVLTRLLRELEDRAGRAKSSATQSKT